MSYEPHTRTTERDVIVTPPQGPNYGAILIATVLAILAIVAAVWLFANDGDTTTDTTNPAVETTLPVETTVPTETTVPADTEPTTAP